MQAPQEIARAADARIRDAYSAIQNSVNEIENGRPLEAEPSDDRKVDRIIAVARVDTSTARQIAAYRDPGVLGLRGEALARAEAIQGKTVDYLGVAWLEGGRIAARAVARILFPDGSPNGTGFLVSPRLLLTNNHVIPSAQSARDMIVEFSYELPWGEKKASPMRFEVNPSAFFQTNGQDDLDYTLIALGKSTTDGAKVVQFGSCPLSGSGAKHSIGEHVNIIEHPDGDYKQVVVRESRIVHRGETVLHYLADTEPGSSGSPVFNDQWQVIALHHWGGPHRELSANGRPLSRMVNEGIRVSCIVDDLKQREARMTEAQRQTLREALTGAPAGDSGVRLIGMPSTGPQAILGWPRPVTDPVFEDAVELEESAEAGGAPASRIDRKYTNRKGYNPRFVPGLVVPLPQLNALQRKDAAKVTGAPASSPFEAKYEHFSIVVNKNRRMPFYSACNIDGAKKISVNRDTGLATSEPEATEVWATDPRIAASAQLDDKFYRRLNDVFRTSKDFFARGHMTRREDPNWGVAASAQKANNDTFHHTNACPQIQNAFNGSQKAWQGIENYILNATDDLNLKVTVITGPVFSDDDPEIEDSEFGTIAIPRRFWKVVARVEDGEPKVFAVLADQSETLDKLLTQGGEGMEATFAWPTKLSKEFQSTVEKIEKLTGLDFGDLALHDVFAGQEESLISGPEDLFPGTRVEGGFGRFESIGDFLEEYEQTRRPAPAEAAESVEFEEGIERRQRLARPAPRPRQVVEVEAEVSRVFADDLSGSKHQQFSVILTSVTEASDETTHRDVDQTLDQQEEVRVAVRFGDSLGIEDRIAGIRTGAVVYLKGEWIPSERAFAVGGEPMPVLHFTHDPVGYVCTEEWCYS